MSKPNIIFLFPDIQETENPFAIAFPKVLRSGLIP